MFFIGVAPAIKKYAVVLACLVVSGGCASPKPPSASVSSGSDVRFEDAVPTNPDLFLFLRPQAIRRDAVFGRVWQQLFQLAIARGVLPTGMPRSVEAIDSADELLAFQNEGASQDATVVIRGVRANLDPARIIDSDGSVVWKPKETMPGFAEEYLSTGTDTNLVLFVLPRRVWMIGMGRDAVSRTRGALSQPPRKRNLSLDEHALAGVRIRGSVLTDRLPALRLGTLAPIGKGLRSLTILLLPGIEGEITATFVYSEESLATAAEARMRQARDSLRSSLQGDDVPEREGRLRWLAYADTCTEARKVLLTTKIPPPVLEELQNARLPDL